MSQSEYAISGWACEGENINEVTSSSKERKEHERNVVFVEEVVVDMTQNDWVHENILIQSENVIPLVDLTVEDEIVLIDLTGEDGHIVQ
jgi:hypothetical protein